MARINVEDSIYKDARFIDLLISLGSKESAIGALVIAWSVAQEYFLKNGGKIPLSKWSQQKLKNEIIDCGLASIVDGEFVYLSGTENQFAWLKTASNKGAKSGEARRLKSLKKKTNTVEPSSTQLNPVEPRGTSYSSSYSSSFSNSYSNTNTDTYTPTAEPERANAVPETAGAVSRFPPLVKIWNENRGTLPEVKSLSSKRTRLITARWKGTSDASIWEGRVRRMAASAFCCGANQTGWRANFDFFLKEDVLTRLDEGQFDNRKPFSAPNEKVMDEFDRQWKEEQRKKEEQRIREIEGW